MLDAFIIEEIKRRERARQEQERPVAELPLPNPDDRPKRRSDDEIRARIPLHRFGEPREVAQAVRFLASDEASYITGEVLHVTGGFGL